MWEAAERHPVRTLLGFAIVGLIVVNGVWITYSAHPPRRRTWPLIAWAVLSLAALPASVLVRTRPELQANKTQALLAQAMTPILLAAAASSVGAALWCLWAALALAIALAAWWAANQRTAVRVSTPEGRP